MFKFENFKLLRKFLILAVLSGGLFLTIDHTKASGDFCCSICDGPYMECIAYCTALHPNSPGRRQQCIQQECWPPFYSCMQQGVCEPSC